MPAGGAAGVVAEITKLVDARVKERSQEGSNGASVEAEEAEKRRGDDEEDAKEEEEEDDEGEEESSGAAALRGGGASLVAREVAHHGRQRLCRRVDRRCRRRLLGPRSVSQESSFS